MYVYMYVCLVYAYYDVSSGMYVCMYVCMHMWHVCMCGMCDMYGMYGMYVCMYVCVCGVYACMICATACMYGM